MPLPSSSLPIYPSSQPMTTSPHLALADTDNFLLNSWIFKCYKTPIQPFPKSILFSLATPLYTSLSSQGKEECKLPLKFHQQMLAPIILKQECTGVEAAGRRLRSWDLNLLPATPRFSQRQRSAASPHISLHFPASGTPAHWHSAGRMSLPGLFFL